MFLFFPLRVSAKSNQGKISFLTRAENNPPSYLWRLSQREVLFCFQEYTVSCWHLTARTCLSIATCWQPYLIVHVGRKERDRNCQVSAIVPQTVVVLLCTLWGQVPVWDERQPVLVHIPMTDNKMKVPPITKPSRAGQYCKTAKSQPAAISFIQLLGTGSIPGWN